MAQANPLAQTPLASAYVDLSPDFVIDEKLYGQLQSELEGDETLNFAQNANISNLFESDTAYRRYLTYRYADMLLKLPEIGTQEDKEKAATFLQGLSDIKDQGTRANVLQNYRNRIRLYQKPAVNIEPLTRYDEGLLQNYLKRPDPEGLSEYDRFLSRTRGIAGPGLEIDPSEDIDPVGPPRDSTPTDYPPIGMNLMTEEERKEFAANGINPDRYFNAGQSYQDQFITGFREGDLGPDTLGARGFDFPPTRDVSVELPTPLTEIPARRLGALTKNQLIFNEDMPWRLKLYAGGAFNPTPEEAEFAMANEFPDIKGRIRYLFPLQPDRGLGVLVPKLDDSGEMELIPLRPEAGLEEIVDIAAAITMQETTPILLEVSRGKLSNTVRRLSNGLRRLFNKQEKTQDLVRRGGVRRGLKNAAVTGAEVAVGRVMQLAAARNAGVNNLSFERMPEDADMAAVMASLGSLGVSTTLGTLTAIYNKLPFGFGGKDIPEETLEDLFEAIEELKLRRVDKDSPIEFTNEELNQIAREAGESIGKDAELKLTLGQLTGRQDIQQLEAELYSFLSARDFPQTKQFEEAIINNREVAVNFWNALTKQADTDITVDQFIQTIRNRQAEIQGYAKAAAEREKTILKTRAELPQRVGSEYKLGDETAADVASVFTEKTPGNFLHRQSPVLLKQADEEHALRVSNFENAVQGLSDLEVDPTIVQAAFRELRDKGGQDRIVKLLGDVRFAEAIREITPMGEGGVSTLRRLAGEEQVTDKGEVVPPIKYDLPTLFGIKESVESILRASSDGGVQAAAIRFRDTIDEQIENTLDKAARKDLEAQGISPTPNLVAESRKTSERFAEYNETRMELMNYRDIFDRNYVKNLANLAPAEVLPFVMNSTAKELQSFVDLVNRGSDSQVKLGALRKLVIQDIGAIVDPAADLATQNKQWSEYLGKNEEQLKILFPEADFLELQNWSKVLKTAEADEKKIQVNLEAIEDMLGIDEDFSDFIRKLFGTSGDERLTDSDLVALQNLGGKLEQFPQAQQQAFQVFQSSLKRRIEDISVGEEAGKQPALNLFGNFNLDKFKTFINDGFQGGQTGQDQLAQRLIPIFGKDLGRRYARDLRAFAFITGKQKPATADAVLRNATNKAQLTTGEWQGLISAIQRITMSPFSRASRQVTFAQEKLRLNAQADLLDIVVNPHKLNKYIKSRNRKFTRNQWYQFIGGLAASREEDIGTSRGEQPFEQKLDTLGDFPTAVMSRITDLLGMEEEENEL